MITAISIMNFKGIRGTEDAEGNLQPLEIELRPITLLFGANSAGKSSILHALHYAHEIFTRQNLNPDTSITGGAAVDLGGFESFVHARDCRRPIRLELKLDLRGVLLPTFQDRLPPGVPTIDPEPFIGEIESAAIRIEVAWSELLGAPAVSEYTVTVNDAWLGTISYQPGRRDVRLRFDVSHPVFVHVGQHDFLPLGSSDVECESDAESGISYLWRVAVHQGTLSDSPLDGVPLANQRDAFVNPDHGISLPADYSTVADFQTLDEARVTIEWIQNTLNDLLAGPARLIRKHLSESRYLGPVRDIPPRNYAPPKHPDPSRWATGLGAWDRLATSESGELLESVSHWLGDENRLNSGYRLRLKRFKELDLSDPLVVQLLTGRAFDDADIGARLDLDNLPTQSRVLIVPVDGSVELGPSDVGIGISQVVPVLVTALDGTGRLIAIEQPELHLHPKLQAELADLFIEAANGQAGRVVLLETHSELIPLRIMRRIRETFEQRNQERVGITAEDVAIYYVELFNGATVVTRLNLSERGQLLDPWPEGFFEEGFRERFSD